MEEIYNNDTDIIEDRYREIINLTGEDFKFTNRDDILKGIHYQISDYKCNCGYFSNNIDEEVKKKKFVKHYNLAKRIFGLAQQDKRYDGEHYVNPTIHVNTGGKNYVIIEKSLPESEISFLPEKNIPPKKNPSKKPTPKKIPPKKISLKDNLNPLKKKSPKETSKNNLLKEIPKNITPNNTYIPVYDSNTVDNIDYIHNPYNYVEGADVTIPSKIFFDDSCSEYNPPSTSFSEEDFVPKKKPKKIPKKITKKITKKKSKNPKKAPGKKTEISNSQINTSPESNIQPNIVPSIINRSQEISQIIPETNTLPELNTQPNIVPSIINRSQEISQIIPETITLPESNTQPNIVLSIINRSQEISQIITETNNFSELNTQPNIEPSITNEIQEDSQTIGCICSSRTLNNSLVCTDCRCKNNGKKCSKFCKCFGKNVCQNINSIPPWGNQSESDPKNLEYNKAFVRKKMNIPLDIIFSYFSKPIREFLTLKHNSTAKEEDKISDEMQMCFWVVYIIMFLHPLENITDYWDTQSPLFFNSMIPKLMTYQQFYEVLNAIKIPDKEIKMNSDFIQEIINIFNQNNRDLYFPGGHMCTDECLKAAKAGTNPWKVNCKGFKPDGEGYKFYLCADQNFFAWFIILYMGKSIKMKELVTEFVETLPNKNNNFFFPENTPVVPNNDVDFVMTCDSGISTTEAAFILQNKIGIIMAIKANSKKGIGPYWNKLKKLDLKKNDFAVCHIPGTHLNATRVEDKKSLFFLTNTHIGNLVEKDYRLIADFNDEYNHSKPFVDLIGYYSGKDPNKTPNSFIRLINIIFRFALNNSLAHWKVQNNCDTELKVFLNEAIFQFQKIQHEKKFPVYNKVKKNGKKRKNIFDNDCYFATQCSDHRLEKIHSMGSCDISKKRTHYICIKCSENNILFIHPEKFHLHLDKIKCNFFENNRKLLYYVNNDKKRWYENDKKLEFRQLSNNIIKLKNKFSDNEDNAKIMGDDSIELDDSPIELDNGSLYPKGGVIEDI